MNDKKERLYVSEYYDNPKDFIKDVQSINVRKLLNDSDKKLIQKLKRWIKTYWGEDGSKYELYESQYTRLKMMIEQGYVKDK